MLTLTWKHFLAQHAFPQVSQCYFCLDFYLLWQKLNFFSPPLFHSHHCWGQQHPDYIKWLWGECASIATSAVPQLLLYWIKGINHMKFCHWLCNRDTELVRSQRLRSLHSGTQPCKHEYTMSCNRDSTITFSPPLGSLSEVHPSRRELWGRCSWLCPWADGRRNASWAARLQHAAASRGPSQAWKQRRC